MWITHRDLLLRLPWSTRVCPSENSVQKRHSCPSLRGPSDDKCAGWVESTRGLVPPVKICTWKPVATGVRDQALAGDFPRAWWPRERISGGGRLS